MSDLFVIASREAYRFASPVGQLTVEQLWDLPLTARGNANSLDLVAKIANKDIKDASEESFVKKQTKANTTLQNKFNIIKFIIDTKLSEEEQRVKAAEVKAEKDTLTEILHRKQMNKLESMSEEDINKRLKELG